MKISDYVGIVILAAAGYAAYWAYKQDWKLPEIKLPDLSNLFKLPEIKLPELREFPRVDVLGAISNIFGVSTQKEVLVTPAPREYIFDYQKYREQEYVRQEETGQYGPVMDPAFFEPEQLVKWKVVL